MRITGGQARSIVLKLPASGEIRPSTDFLREAVFSSLGASVVGARVLDVFAGTGAYGLEALSRGASEVVFVEKNPAAATAIRANIAAVAKACGTAESAAKVVAADALRWLGSAAAAQTRLSVLPKSAAANFDLIFCDPPWALWEKNAAKIVEELTLLVSNPDALLLLETPGEWEPPIPQGWHLHRRLSKGARQPAISILTANAA